ncbi:MAG: A/G-specific adenine glycosylase [Aquirufa sp.]|jgi:A/G-specific adenine glycosylase
MKKSPLHPFAESLLVWYNDHARDLPWRQTRDPYLIWLSEIILQQTRVAQGLPYFYKLSEAFPTVYDLAAADETTLFRLWQGLGYYSRARNLHKTAKYVVDLLDGNFPDSYAELIKLPGVGPYTAAAIASFAFDEATPVVDGNVFRILARYFGIETDIMHSSARKEFTTLAQELIPSSDPARFNQAIMEFGSLQCSPSPSCDACPLVAGCFAYTNGRINDLPVKSKAKAQRIRNFQYFIIEKGGEILVHRRQKKDIWQGLWEFFCVESEDLNKSIELYPFLSLMRDSMEPLNSPGVHVLSHQKIVSQAFLIRLPQNFTFDLPDDYQWILSSEFEQMGKPVLLLNLITDNFALKEILDS